MKDSHDILAVLLAADDHPHLREEATYREAKALLDESAELQRDYEEARTFFDKHPVLVGIRPMPEDVRDRIRTALEKNASLVSRNVRIELSPWTVRTQFGWAALLVLLLAAMALLSSHVANRGNRQERMLTYRHQPPADAFRSFAGDLVEVTPPLEEMNADTAHLVHWLQSQASAPLGIPEAFQTREGVGCAYLDGPDGKVSLLCLKIEDRIVHLFITDAASLNLSRPQPPERMVIHDRQAVQWNDEQNAYLLMTHQPDTELPELFL